MRNYRALLCLGALGLLASGSARAQGPGHVSLTPLLTAHRYAVIMQDGVSPLSNLTLRGGAMVTPRGGGMAGIDFAVPSLSLGSGWQGRLDADIIFKANFGGVNEIVPVTLNQIYYAPEAVGGRSVYYGAGVGAILSGKAKFDGKLILGVELTQRLGAEVNVHFNEEDTIVTLLARLHL